MSARNPTFAFYLTPFRAWELALGALLSVEFLPVPESAFWRNSSGVSGLLLLLGVIAFGSPAVPLLAMTGLAAVGTALVIASSERAVSAAGRLLSLRSFVFVGLISYSLYLWHWPLTVFQRTDAIFFAESSASAKLILIALSIGIAYLSWKLVETPFRTLAKGTSKAAIFGATSATMASTVGLCGNGVPVERSPVPLSQAHRRDRLLPGL
jgi:peptidoglycan/LPS O-acetylase OafA/YrhL